MRRRTRSLFTRKSGTALRSPHQRRLALETLEDRRLLAITVNTLIDELDGSIVDGDISLRDAIAASPAGGVINFSVTGTINLALGEVVVQDRILEGPGAAQLTINANQLSRVFQTFGTTTLAGLTITGGKHIGFGGGGGISNETSVGVEGFLTLRDSIVTGNSAGRGGGIYSAGYVGAYSPTSAAPASRDSSVTPPTSARSKCRHPSSLGITTEAARLIRPTMSSGAKRSERLACPPFLAPMAMEMA